MLDLCEIVDGTATVFVTASSCPVAVADDLLQGAGSLSL